MASICRSQCKVPRGVILCKKCSYSRDILDFLGGCFHYAILRRDRTIRLLALWVVIVPLPLAFLVPIRGGGSLYLLLFGWAMIFAKVACDLIAVISKAVISVGQRITVATGTGERIESDGGSAVCRAHGALGGNSSNSYTTGVRVAVFAVLALCFAIFTDWENRRVGNVPALLGVGQKVSHVIAAFDSLNLRPAPHSTVLLKVEEPLFQNKWHSLFIASFV